MDKVAVQAADFDPGAEIEALAATGGDAGAVASFVGLVRHEPAAGGIQAMTLEHYPGMTEKALAAIVAEARQRWPLLAVRLIHRVGRLLPGERIVLVAVSSSHRQAAFAACEFIMDYLKTQAPFWKREETATGGRWVDARESDAAALNRWVKRSD
jgi:molybdopterin synthase catalytic subunit